MQLSNLEPGDELRQGTRLYRLHGVNARFQLPGTSLGTSGITVATQDHQARGSPISVSFKVHAHDAGTVYVSSAATLTHGR